MKGAATEADAEPAETRPPAVSARTAALMANTFFMCYPLGASEVGPTSAAVAGVQRAQQLG